MAEYRSALAAACKPGRIGAPQGRAPVAVHERTGRTLVQVSGWPESLGALRERIAALLGCAMPADCRVAVSQGARTVFRVAPERLWIAGPADDERLLALAAELPGDTAVVTAIGASRTVLRVSGTGARLLINRGLPVDLDASAFPADAFAQSVIHLMPVLVHRVAASGDDVFDIYVTRDYAVSFWEWLVGAAQSMGCDVGEPG